MHLFKLAILPVLFGLLLWYLPWEPDVVFGFPAADTSAARAAELAAQPQHGPGWVREQHAWSSHGVACDAWLFLPAGSAGEGTASRDLHAAGTDARVATKHPPVILMASGMGAQRDHRLPDFAAQFAAAGYAAFLFDYRRWGGSSGQPRHLVWGWDHVGDYMAAVKYIQDTGGLGGRVDPQRIILWGSSYSGGHSLVTASLHGCDAAPGSTLPTAAATHAENTTAGHGSDAAQGNEAQHNASQRAPLLGTANSSSGIVAVVVMEPFVSAPLLVKRALFLNACPVGRASEEGVTARAARARRGQHGSPPNAAAAAAGWVARAAAVVCSAADQVMWGVGEMLRGVRILLVACSDVVRGWTGQPAAYLPLVLPESRVAGLQHKDAPPRSCVRSLLGRLTAPISMGVMPDEDFGLFMSSRPEHMLGGWQNMVAARMVFGYATYHPMGQLPGGTRCPVHMVAGLQDTLTPLHTIKHAAQQLGPIASVTALNGTHITLYEAPGLIPDMLQFLHAAVPLTPAPYT